MVGLPIRVPEPCTPAVPIIFPGELPCITLAAAQNTPVGVAPLYCVIRKKFRIVLQLYGGKPLSSG